MAATGMVAKTGRNDFHNYAYATEADVVETVRPHMVKNGLMLIPSVETVTHDQHGNTHVIVNYRLYHTSGEFLDFNIAASGNDKNKTGVGDKGIYKALTGASKYAILKMFCLATGDDPEIHDKNAKDEDDLPPIPPLNKNEKSADALLASVKMCANMAESKEELNEWYRENKLALDSLKNLDEGKFNEALDFLKARKAQL